MALRKEPGSPFLYYDFYFLGKRHRGSTEAKTKMAAREVEAKVLLGLMEGSAPKRRQKPPTLREFSTRWLEWVETSRTLKPNSRKYYEYGWRLLSLSRLAEMYIDQITTEMVDCTSFERPVINRKTKESTGVMVPCSKSYTSQALRTLKTMLGSAIEWKILSSRPKFAMPATVARDQMIDQDAEIRIQDALQIETESNAHRWMRSRAWLVVVVLQDTGMRPCEVFPMRIENLHFDADRIWVPNGKTKNATRFVSMSERVKRMLLDATRGRSGWVFPSKRAKSGHLESISKSFAAACVRAGVDPRIVPYSARHTYATYQVEATGNIFAVSKSMGHANVQSMTPYQHADTSQLNRKIDERNRARELRRFQLLTDSQTFGQTTSTIQ